MSFTIAYRPFCSVFVEEHGGGPKLPAFSLAPTSDSAKTLADHQIAFRPRDAGFQLFFSSNPLAADPLLGRIRARTRFGFTMFLGDDAFLDSYEPDLTTDTGVQFYFDNLTATGNIQGKNTLTVGTRVQASDAASFHPPVFFAKADMSGANPPATFFVKEKFKPTPPAPVVLQVPISAGAGSDQALTKIDMAGHPNGAYRLETDAGGSAVKTIYLNEALARARAVGIVDIYWDGPQDGVPAGGLEYFIRFRRK